MNNRLTILGAGESGVGAALLGINKGYAVWLSDNGDITNEVRKEIEENSIAYELGGHSKDKILKSGLIVKSPGISDNVDIVQAAIDNGIEVISEIEFAARQTNKPIIAITGSNGKTTTTLLINHLLVNGGIKAGLAGNIGSSLARHVLADEADIFVVEVSSFQLDGIIDFRPSTAVLLNITPDHLDRYDYDFDRYAESKISIVKNMISGLLVYNMQDPELAKRREKVNPGIDISTFSINKDTDSRVNDNKLEVNYLDQHISIGLEDLPLKGEHNQMNHLAAITVALSMGVSNKSIVKSLSTFKNQPNRLEFITNIDGIEFVNDSKATNVEAVYYALGSFDKPIVWIAGGQDKGNNYDLIDRFVKEKVKAMVCLGLENDKLIEHFAGYVDKIAEAHDTDEAARLALDYADPEDVVLLSPACASFDLFDNYAQRGELFKQSVLNLKEGLS